MACGSFKDLARKTASDTILRDKAFNIAGNSKQNGYQRGLTSIVYTFFEKNSASLADKSAKDSGVNNEIKQNQQLVEESHTPIKI